MQDAWSMDFISWFFTHVSQSEFITLASLSGRGGRTGRGGRIMRQDVPAKRKIQCPKCSRTAKPLFVWSHWRWQTLIVRRLTRSRSRKKRSGSDGVKVKSGPSVRRRSEMKDVACMCFSSLAVNRSRLSFSFSVITVGDVHWYSPKPCLWRTCLLMTGRVYICKACFVLGYFTFFKTACLTAKIDVLELLLHPGKRRFSQDAACFSPLDLKHQTYGVKTELL